MFHVPATYSSVRKCSGAAVKQQKYIRNCVQIVFANCMHFYWKFKRL